ncbi:MAG TPA: DUF3859 domain-containing protein [Xanthobacteraceae bacterium]|nr:DUF3859 domain-containing protein [Xanthobacteraceae bacterium]
MHAWSFFLPLIAVAAFAQTPTPTVVEPSASVTAVTVTHAGSFSGQSTSKPAEAGQQSPTRTVGTVSDWQFVSDSTAVDGKVGTQFGIEFRIEGTPAEAAVTLRLEVTFPPDGIRNPNTGERMHSAAITFPNMTIGALCLIGYGFGNAWEIVPGDWKLQVMYHDRVLAERTFTVGKPQ